jgi:hypothetical protein
MIDLPVRFPSQEDVIADEVARFRALSAEDRVRALSESVALYHFLIDQSRHSGRLREFAADEEARAAGAIRAFAARHA